MTAYILTAEAESDLRSVIRYTRAQWGAAQVRRYVSGLERGIANLAEGKGPFKDMSARFIPRYEWRDADTTMSFVCLERMRALIVAILHERMDLMKRLVDRLNE
ncbi:type II toxin-antitoxin system RelE/ParE family toxin [Neorhizobium sp. S3-V5DH]|uniref:type II toxin-antitoxin system RelE/ParE family toxin n=1 Tax=Neorhizobium sp. S3-V5DH TaxID=2485166 RepID=UPI001047E654|nr:type II toxin-antitoxin system RelE/ParE family toxin [Neorhizobium sp. S3-V5DH]TCV58357.1 plasmid stabilization system protein ParE [Neorhizobium sp. S3-V5DH]